MKAYLAVHRGAGRAARALHRPRRGGVHRRGLPRRHRQPAAVRPAARHRPPHPGAGLRRARRHLLHRHRAHQAAGQAGRRPQQAGRHRRAHRRRRARPPARPAGRRGLRHRAGHAGAARRPRPHHGRHAAGRAVPAARRGLRPAAPTGCASSPWGAASRRCAASGRCPSPSAARSPSTTTPTTSSCCAPRCSRSPTAPSPSCAARAWRRAPWRSRCASTPSTPSSRRRTLARPVSATRPIHETAVALLDELDIGARWVRLVGRERQRPHAQRLPAHPRRRLARGGARRGRRQGARQVRLQGAHPGRRLAGAGTSTTSRRRNRSTPAPAACTASPQAVARGGRSRAAVAAAGLARACVRRVPRRPVLDFILPTGHDRPPRAPARGRPARRQRGEPG